MVRHRWPTRTRMPPDDPFSRRREDSTAPADADLLLEVLAELRALRADVAALRREREPRTAEALARVIVEYFHAQTWLAREIVARSLHDDAAGLMLRAELVAALGANGARSAKKLGWFLLQNSHRDFGDIRIVRVGEDRSGTLWRIDPA